MEKCDKQYNSIYPDAGHPDRLGPSGKFVEKSTKTNLPWNNQLSDQVQYSVTASRTATEAWSKSLEAGTYCKWGPRWHSG